MFINLCIKNFFLIWRNNETWCPSFNIFAKSVKKETKKLNRVYTEKTCPKKVSFETWTRKQKGYTMCSSSEPSSLDKFWYSLFLPPPAPHCQGQGVRQSSEACCILGSIAFIVISKTFFPQAKTSLKWLWVNRKTWFCWQKFCFSQVSQVT